MAGSSFMLAPDEWSGRRLGKYEILCRLSTGGMSEIFLAFQKGLAGFRKFIVLKQILPDIKGEEEFVRMFLDEAKITAAFNHPNIAQVYDLDIAEGELFLAMEFVPGATLVEVARACRQANEPIPVGFTLQAVRDTALALHYAHTFTDPTGRVQQVIHRDIAEKNIMVTYDGTTKLLDFGIAKALNRSSRTTVGMVKGTSGYMSPEQILGEKLDPRSDQFSLGVVLHECLTGMRLFHGKTPEDGMLQALKGEIAPPSKQNALVVPELDAVTLKALSRQRDDRYASCLEFARAIERAVGPSIWHPEETAPFVQRMFAERREQTRSLMTQAQYERTGDFTISQLVDPPVRAAPPPPPIPAAPTPPPRRPPRASGQKAMLDQPSTAKPLDKVPRRKKDGSGEKPFARNETTDEITLDRQKPPPPPVPESTLAPEYQYDPLEDKTIPATVIPPEELAAILGHGPSGEHNVLPEEITKPGGNFAPRAPDHEEGEASVTESGRTLHGENSVSEVTHPTRGRKGGRFLGLTVMVVALAVIGGTVYALGLHHELLKLVDGGSVQVVSDVTQPRPIEPPPSMAPPDVQPVVIQEQAPEPVEAPPKVEPVVAVQMEQEAVPDAGPAPVAVQPAQALVTSTEVAEKKEPERAVVRTPRPRPQPKEPVKEKEPKEFPIARAVTEGTRDAADKAWEAAEAKARTRPEKSTGMLTLVTEPWSTVFMGSKEIGITPLVKQELPAGSHTLKLVGPDKKAVALPVEISNGNETRLRVPLSSLKPL